VRQISEKSCYYYYGRQWKSWDQLRTQFKWEIPEKMNAAYYVCEAHSRDSSKVAIFYEDHRGKKGKMTFRELEKSTNKLANFLRSRGLSQGDRVAVCLAQRPENIISHIAIWKLGGVSVPLTILFGQDSLRFRLEHSDAKMAVIEDGLIEDLRKLKHELKGLKEIVVVGEIELQDDEVEFWSAIREMSSHFIPVLLNSDDNMLIAYTGGTTGDPKGVVHRHSFIFHVSGHYGALMNAEIRPGDICWSPADFAWIAPLFDLAFPALFYGTPVLTYAWGGKFDPERALRLIESYRLSIVYMPPTALRMIRQLEHVGQRFDLSSVRVLVSGGEALGNVLPEWVKEAFGSQVVIHETYGQTECTFTTMNCQKCFGYKHNIGKAPPGLDVETLDDKGNILSPGEVGEIAVRAFDGNPNVFKQYWKSPQETKAKFKNNWMLSGDLGLKDREGYFTFIGRRDDILNLSGYRIGPSGIEDTLMKHPAVVEVGVIGIPDDLRGEIAMAFVVLSEGYTPGENLKNELQEFVKQKLGKHEYPREIAFCSALPKTTTGKIRRADLRKFPGQMPRS